MSRLNQLTDKEENLWQVFETDIEVPRDVFSTNFRSSFERQLSAFRMLSAGAMERFSKDTFYRMLMNITRKRHPIRTVGMSKVSIPPSYISSIQQLKIHIASLKNGKRRACFTADEVEKISNYFSVLLNDLDYLRDLKTYFDDRILRFILEVTNHATVTVLSRQRNSTNSSSDRDSDSFSSQTRLPKLKMAEDYNTPGMNGNRRDFVFLSKDEIKDISSLVNSLRSLEVKWANLLRDSEIESNDFEKETMDALRTQRERPPFELIWYLIPDLFAKASKAVKLARQWILKVTSYNSNNGSMVSPDTQKRITETWVKISDIEQSIVVDEEKAKVLEMEMKRLSLKEHRHNLLAKDYKSTREKIEQIGANYHSAMQEQRSLNRKLQDAFGLSTEGYSDIVAKLDRLEWRISSYQNEMKILKFSLSILQQDLVLEADMRSTFIRFQDSVKDMLSSLGTRLEIKKDTKRKMEKELVLLKANNKKLLCDENSFIPEEVENEVESEEQEQEDTDDEDDIYININENFDNEKDVYDQNMPHIYLYTNGKREPKMPFRHGIHYNKNLTISKIPSLQTDTEIFITTQNGHSDKDSTIYVNPRPDFAGNNQKKSRIPKPKVY